MLRRNSQPCRRILPQRHLSRSTRYSAENSGKSHSSFGIFGLRSRDEK